MSFPDDLAPLIKPIKALQRLLERFGERGVIIGGIATGFLGKPRFTVDLDAMFLASIKDIPEILELAKKEGIEVRTLDVSRIERWTKDFGELLEMPELWGLTEGILKQ